jgi:hypothetical protein
MHYLTKMRSTGERLVVAVFLVFDIAPLAYAATQSWFWQRHSVAPTSAAIELAIAGALVLGRYRWAWVLLTLLFGLEVVGWPLTADPLQASSILWAGSNAVALAALLSSPMRRRLRRPVHLGRMQGA